LRLLAAYCDAVRRVPLPAAERARCGAVIARYLLQVNKWKSVMHKAWSGMGMAGEYPSLNSSPEGGEVCAVAEKKNPNHAAPRPQLSKP
jgi:hypothetical protein